MSKYVHGRVRLATSSPRVGQYDYGTKSYQPADYYGDHFMYRDDPNLLPVRQGLYASFSPTPSQNALTAYPPRTLYSPHSSSYSQNWSPTLSGGCSCANMGYLGNTEGSDVSDVSDAAEEEGFDLLKMGTDLYKWSQTEEGQAAIEMGKDIYDQSKGIGSGGSSTTKYKGLILDGKPLGQWTTEELIAKIKSIVSYLVPKFFAKESDIPIVEAGALVKAVFGQGDPLSMYKNPAVKSSIRIYNSCVRELLARFGSLQEAGYFNDGSSNGGGASNGGGTSKGGAGALILGAGALALLAKVLL